MFSAAHQICIIKFIKLPIRMLLADYGTWCRIGIIKTSVKSFSEIHYVPTAPATHTSSIAKVIWFDVWCFHFSLEFNRKELRPSARCGRAQTTNYFGLILWNWTRLWVTKENVVGKTVITASGPLAVQRN